MTKREEYQRFWNWFTENEPALRREILGQAETRQPGPTVNAMAEQLQVVHPDLTYLVGPLENNEMDFVISANGMLDAVSTVIALHAAAPPRPDWRFTAFRPRTPGDGIIIELGGQRVAANDVHAVVVKRGSRAAVVLYVPKGTKRAKQNEVKQAMMVLLDHVLGEYTVVTHIGSISFSDAAPPPKAVPLPKLVGEVDRMFLH